MHSLLLALGNWGGPHQFSNRDLVYNVALHGPLA